MKKKSSLEAKLVALLILNPETVKNHEEHHVADTSHKNNEKRRNPF
jgi:hypothetical protein